MYYGKMVPLASLKKQLCCNRICVTNSLLYFWREKLHLIVFQVSDDLQTCKKTLPPYPGFSVTSCDEVG